MEGHRGSIKFRPIKSNLVNLPANLSNLLYTANIQIQDVIIEIVSNATKKKLYAGWTGMLSAVVQTVEIDPVFAGALGLKDDEKITLNLKIGNFEAGNINLEPVTSSDWELVELHAQAIEDTLLLQTRCVSVGQILVVYPNQTTSAKLVVVDIGSKDHVYAKISPYCEIAIAPKVREKKETVKSLKNLSSSKSNGAASREDYSSMPVALKRGISLPHNLFSDTQNRGYEVYANLSEFNPTVVSDYVAISVIPGPNDKLLKAAPQSTDDSDNRVASLRENKRVIARLVDFPSSPANNVGLSTKLAIALNIEGQIGNIIAIKPAVKNLPKRPTTFIVHPYITQTKKSGEISINTTEKLELQTRAKLLSEYLYNEGAIYSSSATNYTKIPIIPKLLPNGGLLKFRKNDDINAWIKPYNIESKKPIKIELGEELLRAGSFVQQDQKEEELEVIGLDGVIDEIIESFTTSKNTGTLVYGNSGSGKSLVLKLASRKIAAEHGFYTKYVSCDSLMNESFNLLSKNHIFKWLQQCSWNKPSLLILDNVDKILSVEREHLDASKSNQLTEYLISNLEKIHNQHNSNLSILLSASSKEAINKLLMQCHLIENFHHLSPPDKALRLDILDNYIVNKLGCKIDFDLMDLVTETEGYLPNDLKILSDRIYHEVLFSSQDPSAELTVTKQHIEKSIQGYTPSNLRGVKLQKSTISWSDIGGLKEAKNILLETLEWPTKYAPIFANCPLRLRSGILLYGYPGCGKTLLASAIAGQCGLNFISIKGPEILNKYIGASEQSVRELFERAQAAKPCILFFDEFDSIAPKRGHDSTGVTDRVVNQMLTQMDGAEGLDGVYVLAATSRPDLIDSALLRPGRLDKSVICDMPDYDDRLDILKSITDKMDLADDVNLEEIAEKTSGFSGADMQGLGYNAYLKGVHVKLAKLEQENSEPIKSSDNQDTIEFFQVNSEKLKNAKLRPADRIKLLNQIQQLFTKEEQNEAASSKKAQDDSKVYITHENFRESLVETKPSISYSEKRKLERIYSQFVSARDGNMPDGSASNEIGGRTTLM